nr:MAG TPA: hypothetical protein [Caudoviricetes sp.]
MAWLGRRPNYVGTSQKGRPTWQVMHMATRRRKSRKPRKTRGSSKRRKSSRR